MKFYISSIFPLDAWIERTDRTKAFYFYYNDIILLIVLPLIYISSGSLTNSGIGRTESPSLGWLQNILLLVLLGRPKKKDRSGNVITRKAGHFFSNFPPPTLPGWPTRMSQPSCSLTKTSKLVVLTKSLTNPRFHASHQIIADRRSSLSIRRFTQVSSFLT